MRETSVFTTEMHNTSQDRIESEKDYLKVFTALLVSVKILYLRVVYDYISCCLVIRDE
jgi:archaellum biogenesis protein FlaJ (TadC family)